MTYRSSPRNGDRTRGRPGSSCVPLSLGHTGWKRQPPAVLFVRHWLNVWAEVAESLHWPGRSTDDERAGIRILCGFPIGASAHRKERAAWPLPPRRLRRTRPFTRIEKGPKVVAEPRSGSRRPKEPGPP